MSASLAQVYASQGLSYYAKDNYYSADKGVENSHWFGRGAKELGLSGKVNADKFQALLDGYDPSRSEMLSGQPIREYVNKHTGKKIRHRAAMDVTFAPPKSFSIAALVHGNAGALESHRDAVRDTLAMLEEDLSEVREGGRKATRKVKSGNLIVAAFEHDTARAGKGTTPDPLVHTHCLIISATKRPSDGLWRRMSTDQFFNHSAYINRYYLNALAYHAKQRGLSLEKTDHAFEISGYSREQILAFSARSQHIEALGAPTKRAERVLKLRDRPAKGPERDLSVLRPDWRQKAEKIHLPNPGFQAREPGTAERLVEGAQKSTAKRQVSPAQSERVVAAAKTLAREQPVFRRSDVATRLLREEVGVLPSAAVVDIVKGTRAFRSSDRARGGITLGDSLFLSGDDLLRTNRRVPGILPTADDVVRKRGRGVGLLPGEPTAAHSTSPKTLGLLALDVGTRFVPFVNDVRDAYEAVVGRDVFTGRSLTGAERLVTVAGIVAGSGATNRGILRTAIRVTAAVSEMLKPTSAQKENDVRKWNENYRLARLELERGVEKPRRDPFAKEKEPAAQPSGRPSPERETARAEAVERTAVTAGPAKSKREESVIRHADAAPKVSRDLAHPQNPLPTKVTEAHAEMLAKLEQGRAKYESMREVDPEGAKWVKTRIDALEAQIKKAEEKEAQRLEALKKDPSWQKARVNDYNRADVAQEKEQLAKESIRENQAGQGWEK
jgi:conjugative relaxase-like TrwC/TraI family protein